MQISEYANPEGRQIENLIWPGRSCGFEFPSSRGVIDAMWLADCPSKFRGQLVMTVYAFVRFLQLRSINTSVRNIVQWKAKVKAFCLVQRLSTSHLLGVEGHRCM
jgi:hypothetical protein